MKNLINKCFSISHRQSALYAGFGLLFMTAAAIFANFGVIDKVSTAQEPDKVLEVVSQLKSMLINAIVAFFIVVLLDFIVAWAAYVYFRPINKFLSAISAWIRVIYGFIFLYAIFGLFNVFSLLNGSGSLTNAELGSQILSEFNNFKNIWQFGFIFFSVHLVLLGVLSLKSNLILKIIGVFLVIAGLGYLVDSIGILLINGYNLKIAMYTFFGEMFLMIWLIVDGFRKPKPLETEVS